MRRNLTITLDEDLIHKARALAARRGLSLSTLLREELSRLVAADEAYQTAKRAALKRLQRGSSLGGGLLPKRETIQRGYHRKP
jgi:predicted transcriptional regulator